MSFLTIEYHSLRCVFVRKHNHSSEDSDALNLTKWKKTIDCLFFRRSFPVSANKVFHMWKENINRFVILING